MHTHPIEPLEARIAPAKIFTFTDVDNDIVTIKITAGDLNNALTFSLLNDVPRQLQSINFEQPEFIGTNLTVTAKQAAGGDGKVNVGQIRLGGGQAYGTFTIDGDLATMGGGGVTGSIKKIVVGSLGMLGGSTIPGGVGSPFLQTGQLSALEVRGHVASNVTIDGDLPSLKIRGSILGGTGNGTGFISIGGLLKTGVVTGILQGNIGDTSGSLFAGAIGSLTIGGMRGGTGELSGSIFATGTGDIGKLVVKGDVIGGNSPQDARQIHASFIKTLQIDGSLFGGNGVYDLEPEEPGQIFTFNGYGSVLIKGDVVGGNTAFSGAIIAGEDTSPPPFTGQASLGKVTIGGSLRGGDGDFSASILGEGAPGGVRIGNSIIGGIGNNSANIEVKRELIGPFFVGGNIIGGDGKESGRLEMGTEDGSFSPITIRGSVIGGNGPDSGTVFVDEQGASKVTITGSIIGGIGIHSGVARIEAEDGSGMAINVTGSIRGGGGTDSGGLDIEGDDSAVLKLGGSILPGTGPRSGFLALEDMKSATIAGSVIGGTNNAGHIRTEDKVGSLTIGGSVLGVQATAFILMDPVIAVDLADPDFGRTIGKLIIRGDVKNAQILGGYAFVGGVLTALTADVKIGTVQVLGDWTESSLVAGVDDGVNNRFDPTDDTMIAALNQPTITSRIESVTIGGIIFGTATASTDSFGFAAQEFGAFKYSKRVVPVANLTQLPFFIGVGPTNDVTIHVPQT